MSIVAHISRPCSAPRLFTVRLERCSLDEPRPQDESVQDAYTYYDYMSCVGIRSHREGDGEVWSEIKSVPRPGHNIPRIATILLGRTITSKLTLLSSQVSAMNSDRRDTSDLLVELSVNIPAREVEQIRLALARHTQRTEPRFFIERYGGVVSASEDELKQMLGLETTQPQ